jgi:hypothetical protein
MPSLMLLFTETPIAKMTGLLPPTGCSKGGQWGTTTFVGPLTWAVAIASIPTIIGWIIILLFCPLDQRDVYKVGGKLYTADGAFYKSASEHNFEIRKSAHISNKASV